MDSSDHWAVAHFFLTLGFVVIVPGAFVYWIVHRRARAIRNAEVEASYAGAGLKVVTSRMHGGPIVSGTLQGTVFVLTASLGVYTTPAMTVISVTRAPGKTFQISREGSRDLSGHDFVESMFPDPRAREAVRALFSLGFDTVGGRGANVSAIRYLHAELPRLGALRAAVGHLAVLGAIH